MPRGNQTIAVVVHDASFRRAIERLVRAWEFEAEIFPSAEGFLRSTAPESHVCLILDIHLPGTSVSSLLDHLTASVLAPPAIFITAEDGTANGSERPLFSTASI